RHRRALHPAVRVGTVDVPETEHAVRVGRIEVDGADVATGRHDVDGGAVVRVVGALGQVVGRADGDQAVAAGRGEVVRRGVRVAGRRDDYRVLVDVVYGVLPGSRAGRADAEAEVHDVCRVRVGEGHVR